MAKKNRNESGPPSESLSVKDFAERVGVTRQRILKAIETGVLEASVQKIKNGKKFSYQIDEEKGLREWADNIDPAKKRDDDKQAATRELAGEKGGVSGSNYQKAKAAKEFFNAKLAELEFHEKAGKLVSADRVKAESFKIARRVRDTLLAVPERAAAEVATMTDPRAINIYLKEQIAAALKDIADLNDVASRGA